MEHFIPSNPKGFNNFLEHHVPTNDGCPLARYILDGVIPADEIKCTNCPFPKCLVTDSPVQQAKTEKAKTLRMGFLSGLNYNRVLSESK